MERARLIAKREKPGELIHIDIKKLGRIGSVGHRITGRYPGVVNRHHGIGWEFVHVCIDDASRVAFVQVMANQRQESAVAFLEVAVAYYSKLGIRIERVMTDNGSCYRSKTFRAVCRRLGIRQIFTKPTLRGPTAKLSASFRRPFANGPTLAPIRIRINDQPNCPIGSIATIGIDHMVA